MRADTLARPRLSAALVAAAALSACGEPKDFDQDGAPASEDCADRDPWVYPGAPDTPGDGLDANCDGDDESWPYVGTWTLRQLSAGVSGVEVLQSETAEGTLALGEAGEVIVDFGVTLDPAVVGDALPVRLAMTGTHEPLPGAARFLLWAEGDNYGEQMHLDWECALEADELVCAGEFKGFDSSLDAAALLSDRG
jgi:hypothetical protein